MKFSVVQNSFTPKFMFVCYIIKYTFIGVGREGARGGGGGGGGGGQAPQ